MSKKYIIEGGKKLEGTTYVSGSKNASLPIIAATLLNGGINKLYNVPNIHDTQMMFKILETLGCKIRKNNAKIIIDSKNIENYEIPENLMREMRSSVVLAGSLIGKYRTAIFSYPSNGMSTLTLISGICESLSLCTFSTVVSLNNIFQITVSSTS